MLIEVWSDLVCPWCYIGKRNLEAALEQFETTEPIEIVWRSYELDPHAPLDQRIDLIPMLAKKYRCSELQAAEMMERVSEAGRSVGLAYRFDLAKRCNTLDAHRLVRFAAAQNLDQPANSGSGAGALLDLASRMKERLFFGYFCEGLDLRDPEVLVGCAAEIGFDPAEVRAMLASEDYLAAVRSDEHEARQQDITGVPFFRVNGGVGVSGAQPPERLLKMLRKAALAPEASAPQC